MERDNNHPKSGKGGERTVIRERHSGEWQAWRYWGGGFWSSTQYRPHHDDIAVVLYEDTWCEPEAD